MLPTREEAMKLVQDGLSCNSGSWGKVAHCAEKLQVYDEKAYILGLLHDIGKFGVRHFGHVSDGYTYRRLLGCDEVAKIFNPFFQ